MEKIVNRNISPSTRQASSSYRVKIGKDASYDQVTVNIRHNLKADFFESYLFEKSDFAGRESIYFDAFEVGEQTIVKWRNGVSGKLLRKK